MRKSPPSWPAGFGREEPVGTNAKMTMTQTGNLLAGQTHLKRAIIDDDEVVARPAHLHKIEAIRHACNLARSGKNAKRPY